MKIFNLLNNLQLILEMVIINALQKERKYTTI